VAAFWLASVIDTRLSLNRQKPMLIVADLSPSATARQEKPPGLKPGVFQCLEGGVESIWQCFPTTGIQRPIGRCCLSNTALDTFFWEAISRRNACGYWALAQLEMADAKPSMSTT
jgi:hypothetical protein